MHSPQVFYLCIILIREKFALTSERETKNLILLSEKSNISLESYWNLNRSDNDVNLNKAEAPYYDVIQGGNFRSSVIDSWSENPPDEIIIYLFNRIGDPFLYVWFDTRGSSMDIRSWLTQERMIASSFGVTEPLDVKWGTNSWFEFMVKTENDPNRIHFALSSRNAFREATDFPYFWMSSDSTKPFNIDRANMTFSCASGLLSSFGPFINSSEQISVTKINPVIVDRIRVKDDHQQNFLFKFKYSHEPCENKRLQYYRSTSNHIMEMSSQIVHSLEYIAVQCLFIELEVERKIEVDVYGPDPYQQAVVQMPMLMLHGFWYNRTTSTQNSQTVNQFESTTNLETFTQAGSASGRQSTEPMCTCACPTIPTEILNLTPEKVQEKIVELKKTLTVNKTSLSSHIRRLKSMPDDRMSAKSIGYVAGIFLSTVISTIILIDASSFVRNFARRK